MGWVVFCCTEKQLSGISFISKFKKKKQLNRKGAAVKKSQADCITSKRDSRENGITALLFSCFYFAYTIQPPSKNVNHLDTEAWVCEGLTDLNHLRERGRDGG